MTRLPASIGSSIIDPANIDDLRVALNTDPMLSAKDQGVSAEINWSFGGVTLTSISAWREYEDKNYKDNDFTGVDVLIQQSGSPRGVHGVAGTAPRRLCRCRYEWL